MRLFLLLAALAMPPAPWMTSTNSQSDASAQSSLAYPSNMPQTPMNEQVLGIPVDRDNSVELEVTIFTPAGPGPFPLAVINHGAPHAGISPAGMPRHRVSFAADYFLSRGYVVVMPMLRGFAGSGGSLTPPHCGYENFALKNATDISAVIDYMRRRPYVDANRIVIAGQSLGGWNTLALGSLNLPNVKGVVNFVGGMHSSDCMLPDHSLIGAVGHFGTRTSVPSIWFYGDNDSIFSVNTWRAMYDRYTKAGGKAQLVAFGKFMDDSHEMLSSYEGLRIWTPKVDAFLDSIGMPSKPIYPQYMPTAVPPASGYANISNVDAVPYLTDQGRDIYRKFLTRPLPRAIAIATNGGVASFSDGFDPAQAALSACRKSGHPCLLYAMDNDVVWSRPTPEPAPTKYAAISDAAAVPYLNDKGRDGYRKFLALRKPRAFVVAPDGGWDAAALGPDPLAFALDHCGKQHQGCRLYAVDNDVVWAQTQTPRRAAISRLTTDGMLTP